MFSVLYEGKTIAMSIEYEPDDKPIVKPSLARKIEEEESKPKKRGRPTKAEKEEKEKKAVGRPPGTQAIMNEYKARLLRSPNSEKVIQKIFQVALEDEHKHQAACMKMIMDRMLPIRAFEQEVEKGGGRSNVTINITGVGESVSISGSEDSEAIEGELE